jgi:hypothetical protein
MSKRILIAGSPQGRPEFAGCSGQRRTRVIRPAPGQDPEKLPIEAIPEIRMRISSLKFDKKNANRGTERGKQALATSLEEFGAGRSVLIDRKGRIIAGNKTIAQALAAGHKDVVMGGGFTAIAAARTGGRACYGMELDPKYLAVTLEGLEKQGLKPQLSV